jgi:hypothetical protein
MEFFSYLEGIENATETRGDKQININIAMKNVNQEVGNWEQNELKYYLPMIIVAIFLHHISLGEVKGTLLL